MRFGEVDFGKLKFLAKFQTICTQIFKKSTIQATFKNTGLIPYNPKIILQKFHFFLRFIQIITSLLSDFIKEIILVCITILYYSHKIKTQANMLISSV